ncbi:MAG: lysoplasmalogenase, partial [Chitinophagales bacterium]
DDLYFIAGLAAFLLAHIFYIIAFLQLVDEKPVSFQWKYAAPLIIFCFLLLGFLYNGLGEMRFPVIAYAVVITVMGIAAMHRIGRTAKYSFSFVLTGALFFIASDAMIAINKFQTPFQYASFLIMTTYIAAQYLIVSGCVLHIKEKAPQ